MTLNRNRFGFDNALAALAAEQHGVVARRQLYDLGLTRDQIGARIRNGRLHPIHRGVYSVGHRLLTLHGHFMAAVLAGGPHAVVSHMSAGRHYRICEDNRSTTDVTVPRSLHKRSRITWHRQVLPSDEITTYEHIPITTIARTLIDIAAARGPRAMERAMLEAEVRQLWGVHSVQDLVDRHPNLRGAPAARAVLGRRTIAVTDEELEERFYVFLARTRLPMPAFNRWLLVGGTWIRPDCTWEEQRLIAELDGGAAHRPRFEQDRERDRKLLVAGWRVIRITWRQLHEEPLALERDLRALLGV